MNTPMIDRAMAQLVAQGCEKTDISSRDGLIKSIIHGLECLAEDTPSPEIIAAIEAVRKIK